MYQLSSVHESVLYSLASGLSNEVLVIFEISFIFRRGQGRGLPNFNSKRKILTPDNMATAWRRSPKPLLETQPWKLLCIEGKTYLVKGLFSSDSYSILVTDLGMIWEESITEHDLLQKSKVA